MSERRAVRESLAWLVRELPRTWQAVVVLGFAIAFGWGARGVLAEQLGVERRVSANELAIDSLWTAQSTTASELAELNAKLDRLICYVEPTECQL